MQMITIKINDHSSDWSVIMDNPNCGLPQGKHRPYGRSLPICINSDDRARVCPRGFQHQEVAVDGNLDTQHSHP